jgi:hypothetical protein
MTDCAKDLPAWFCPADSDIMVKQLQINQAMDGRDIFIDCDSYPKHFNF